MVADPPRAARRRHLGARRAGARIAGVVLGVGAATPAGACLADPAPLSERRRCDREVVLEGPAPDRRQADRAHGGAQRGARGHAPDEVLGGQQATVLPGVLGAEGAVALERLLAGRAPGEGVAQLAAERQREVERGTDALGGQRQAVPGGVADEEDAVLGGRAQLVRDPVALEAHRRQREVAGERDGRVLDVVAGLERADADAQLAGGREAPAVTGAHVAGVDPDLEVLAGPLRMHLEAAREARLRWLDRPLVR